MRFPLIALMLLATPALAQQVPQQQPPAIEALLGMIHDGTQREAAATVEVISLRRQIDAMKAQIETLKPKPDAK